MRTSITKFIILSLIFIAGCKEENIVGTNQPINLITNFSFEIDDNPSINGWTFESNVISTYKFSNDVPQSGGRWSVVLNVGDRLIKTLHTKVKAPTGRNNYKLSVWAKISYSGQRDILSSVSLELNRASITSISITDSVWKYYEAFCSLNTTLGDTLTVQLHSGTTYTNQKTNFDLCRLELIK